MKKTLLTAALAALTLGAAQAVSLSWSGTAGQSNGTLTLGSLNESFVLTAKITLTDKTPEGFTNNAPVIGFGNFIDAGNQYNGLVWYNGSNGVGAHFGNTWLDAEVPAYAADGQNTHTYTLTFTANATGDGWDVTLTIDGTDVLVASTDNAIDWQNKTPAFSHGNAGVSAGDLDIAITTTADAPWTIDSVSVQTIPEPTALALLALGVAGMALRRRVA